MRTDEICTRDVVICDRTMPILDVARLMRTHHVGTVVVVREREDGQTIPTGIITDRDLTIEVLALEISPDTLTAGDLPGTELFTVNGADDVFETLERMQYKGVRRAPVVDAQGALIGIVALDDLMELVSDELRLMAKVISRERKRERSTRTMQPSESDNVIPRH